MRQSTIQKWPAAKSTLNCRQVLVFTTSRVMQTNMILKISTTSILYTDIRHISVGEGGVKKKRNKLSKWLRESNFIWCARVQCEWCVCFWLSSLRKDSPMWVWTLETSYICRKKDINTETVADILVFRCWSRDSKVDLNSSKPVVQIQPKVCFTLCDLFGTLWDPKWNHGPIL